MTDALATSETDDLFARKGQARPEALLVDSANGARELAEAAAQALDDKRDPKEAGSLLAVDLKRGLREYQQMDSPSADVISLPQAEDKDAPDHQKAEAAAQTSPAAVALGDGGKPTPWMAALGGVFVTLALGLAIWVAAQSSESDGNKPTPTPSAEQSQASDDTALKSVAGTTKPDVDQDSASATPAGPMVPEASFDLVRIEPDGQAVLAGRAAPNTALILLDNGQILGRVTADFAGEWAFVTETPVGPGKHEFGLLVDSPMGAVTIPGPKASPSGDGAAEKSEADDRSIQGSLSKPLAPPPNRKPAVSDLGAWLGVPGKTARYEIQLASVPSEEDVAGEWKRLQDRFPDLLAGRKLVVQTSEDGGDPARYRVRTGAFSKLSDARALCQVFQNRNQDCLVVRQ